MTLHLLIVIVAVILAAGVVAWLIGKAPGIDPTYKSFAQYAILVVVVLWVIIAVFKALDVSTAGL